MGDILQKFPRCARLFLKTSYTKISDTLKTSPHCAHLFLNYSLRKWMMYFTFLNFQNVKISGDAEEIHDFEMQKLRLHAFFAPHHACVHFKGRSEHLWGRCERKWRLSKKETAFAAVQKINEVRVTFDNHALDDFKKRNEHLWGLCNRK